MSAANIVKAINLKEQLDYKSTWWQGGITLTLGLVSCQQDFCDDFTNQKWQFDNVVYLQDGHRVAMMQTKSKKLDSMSARCWKHLGVTPFLDESRPPL